MRLQIDLSSKVPIFEQLCRRVKQGIASGQLKEGDRLPAVRDLAMLLVINPNTVQKAYAELAGEGLVYGRKGMGMFVRAVRQKLNDDERRRRVEEVADNLITEAILLGYSREEVEEVMSERLRKFLEEGGSRGKQERRRKEGKGDA
jgi:GntR family transcriptional regulator